jgi:hypothetical protein
MRADQFGREVEDGPVPAVAGDRRVGHLDGDVAPPSRDQVAKNLARARVVAETPPRRGSRRRERGELRPVEPIHDLGVLQLQRDVFDELATEVARLVDVDGPSAGVPRGTVALEDRPDARGCIDVDGHLVRHRRLEWLTSSMRTRLLGT